MKIVIDLDLVEFNQNFFVQMTSQCKNLKAYLFLKSHSWPQIHSVSRLIAFPTSLSIRDYLSSLPCLSPRFDTSPPEDAQIAHFSLWTSHVQNGQKENDRIDQGQNDGHYDDKTKPFKEDNGASKQENATAKGCDSSTEDRDAHSWNSIWGFVKTIIKGWVDIMCGQVDHIVDGEANWDYCSDRFRNAKLPATQYHDCRDIGNDKNDRRDGIESDDYVLCRQQHNDKG